MGFRKRWLLPNSRLPINVVSWQHDIPINWPNYQPPRFPYDTILTSLHAERNSGQLHRSSSKSGSRVSGESIYRRWGRPRRRQQAPMPKEGPQLPQHRRPRRRQAPPRPPPPAAAAHVSRPSRTPSQRCCFPYGASRLQGGARVAALSPPDLPSRFARTGSWAGPLGPTFS